MLPSRNCQVRVMSRTSTSRISGGRRRMAPTCARCAPQRRRSFVARTSVRSGCALMLPSDRTATYQQVAIQTPPLGLVRVVQVADLFRPCFARPRIGRVLVFLGAGVDRLAPVLRERRQGAPVEFSGEPVDLLLCAGEQLAELGRGFACTVGFGGGARLDGAVPWWRR